jgi:hypothetical protein
MTSKTIDLSSFDRCAEVMADIKDLVTSQLTWLWLSEPDLSLTSAICALKTLFGV